MRNSCGSCISGCGMWSRKRHDERALRRPFHWDAMRGKMRQSKILNYRNSIVLLSVSAVLFLCSFSLGGVLTGVEENLGEATGRVLSARQTRFGSSGKTLTVEFYAAGEKYIIEGASPSAWDRNVSVHIIYDKRQPSQVHFIAESVDRIWGGYHALIITSALLAFCGVAISGLLFCSSSSKRWMG